MCKMRLKNVSYHLQVQQAMREMPRMESDVDTVFDHGSIEDEIQVPQKLKCICARLIEYTQRINGLTPDHASLYLRQTRYSHGYPKFRFSGT